jgi:2-polyprenyl-3-methyl-5-hydroxy-6-metoxy-1,4-benzoquinol methylase
MVQRTFDGVKEHHSPAGHEYIRTHWRRYVHLAMRLPALKPGTRCLEIGASIFSNLLVHEFGASVTSIHHELETEWQKRYRAEGVTSYPCELMRDELPVPDNSFDLVVFDQVLEHFPLAPDPVVRQAIAKLAENGSMLFSTPNFAVSEKRVALLLGKNPQDPMDRQFVYYAHHREPVMQECIDLVDRCGGIVFDSEWSEFDVATGLRSSVWELLRHLRHGRIHRLAHFFLPSTRAYLFLHIGRKKGSRFDSEKNLLPLSTTGEFSGRPGPDRSETR